MTAKFTAKEIRDRSPAWLRFVLNHDRALLARKRAAVKS
jgi:hypothetical protein